MNTHNYRVCIIFMSFYVFFSCTSVFAQSTIREKIKDRMKERREERRESGDGSFLKKAKTRKSDIQGERVGLNFDGQSRYYIIHIPPSYNSSVPAPVVFNFHGGGGNAEMTANNKFTKMISKSDKEGFILVIPNGASALNGKFATWNAGNCCAYARDHNSDDVGFVKAVLEDVESKWRIDHKRIFATGMSNGGMMSYRLACDMSDTFRAVAPVAGTDNYDQCSPTQPVSVLHIHALDDDHVQFTGGAGKSSVALSKVTDYTSVPETIERWVKRNKCGSKPKRVLEVDGAYCDLYSGCSAGTSVKLCVTETGGHSWPGGQKVRAGVNITPSTAIDATDVIWDFFESQ